MLKYTIFITSTDDRLGTGTLQKNEEQCVVLFFPLNCVHTFILQVNFCDLSKVLGFVAESFKKYLGSSIANLPKYKWISLWFNNDNLHFCNKSSNTKEKPVIFYKILTTRGHPRTLGVPTQSCQPATIYGT